MQIAVLYICTGKYNQFFPGFYKSSERYFLPSYHKQYFVWTDDVHLGDGLENVTIIHKKCAGFPADSLFKFEMFLQIENELCKYDYIYFFNANAEVKLCISEEVLPDESGLAMGIWPGRREKQHPMFFPYERNKKSLAYVAPFGNNYTYFMGGLNGGTSSEYLRMIRTLAQNIRDDYNRGIIARVHDESHINAYLRSHKCKKISGDFCLPEEWLKDGDVPKIILRNKVLVDDYFNKGRRSDFFSRLKKAFNIIYNAIIWYL